MSHSQFAPDWKDWDNLAVRISALPPSVTTLDLSTHFERFGNIVFIEIPEDGRGRGTSIVRFSPPPHTACWDDRVIMKIGGQENKVRVSMLSQRPPEEVTTPGGCIYSSRLRIKPAQLQFGVLSRADEFMVKTTLNNTYRDDFDLLLDLKHRKLEIDFSCVVKDPRRTDPNLQHPSPVGQREALSLYKVRIFFSQLTNLLVLKENTSSFSVLIALQSPPLLFKKGEAEETHSEGKKSWGESDAWNRSISVVYDTTWDKHDSASLHTAHRFVDVGRWTTYKVTFPSTQSNISMWDLMTKALGDFNISVRKVANNGFRTIPPKTSDFWSLLEPGTPKGNAELLAEIEEVRLPYGVRYQLEVCISQGYLDEANLGSDFLRKLTDLSSTRKKKRDRANDLLTYVAESGGPGEIDDFNLYPKRFYDPLALFTDSKAMNYYPELGAPSHCTWVRKVVITPSTMYLSTPNPEPSNRVLRRYARYSDRFLRVQFTDEMSKGKIFSAPGTTQLNPLFNRIFRVLTNGIDIGGRHFEFLAFGNSQFRENGAYFFSPTDHIDCNQIRAWMGEFSHIKVVAKYAARLGQCFSTTRALTDSPISQSVEAIDDIERNGWCFSDGVGKISPQLAEYVAKPLRLKKGLLPSAFQFRLGGSKGLLVCWPDMTFNKVSLRPSQKKFNAQSTLLEIVKPSRFSAATLNRQTITILNCLGVPDEAFMRLQRKQLKEYDQALQDPGTAMRLLSMFVDQNGITTKAAQMISDGFMSVKEPFFMCILQVWRAWSLRLLREKARIIVEQGAFVFGCVDETGTLRGYSEPASPSKKEDSPASVSKHSLPQIFLQVPRPGLSPDNLNNYTIIKGLCVVGRNPSLHPGDIRVVEAVDVPALQHLRNVVVFPANGDRDIPSMCSGGDLDGDDFFVIWDHALIPPEQDHPPMIHDSLKPVEITRDVRPSDLVAFFVTYMKNDALCTIAHAHLAQSDALEGGPKHPIAVELAHLHSNAVDYPKSGQPAHLDKKLRPRSYPHFMEKPGKSYHSTKILGQLYDVVNKVEFHPNYNGAFDKRILRRFVLADDVLRKARIIKRQHDRALRKIMNQREIGTEFEVWSTFVLSKPRVGSDYTMQETLGPIIANHCERFRNACIRVAGSREPNLLYPFIAAAYRVTWEAVQVALQKAGGRVGDMALDESKPFISFPWVFEQELGRIATLPTDYELDSLPKLTTGAFEVEEEDSEAQYDQLLGLGVFAPVMEEVEDGELGDGKDQCKTSRTSDTRSSLSSQATQSPRASSQSPQTTVSPQSAAAGEEEEEEVIVLEEIETGMDELEKLMGEE
ncbi:hypothetical protein NPX13_g5792 [Xylaria arbuscula]|uniref:RNA-dependent RNA polymerase n=1 Tax=Xylaria arbuscula TaxID=114810 RepID=A0A9W8NDT7_9PEZI|nr:hypothetical protein NPX13_g5792 [Xylaria arbuscula]